MLLINEIIINHTSVAFVIIICCCVIIVLPALVNFLAKLELGYFCQELSFVDLVVKNQVQ